MKRKTTEKEILIDTEAVRSEMIQGLQEMDDKELLFMRRSWDTVLFVRKEKYIEDRLDLLTSEEVSKYKSMIWLSPDRAYQIIKEREETA